MTDALEAILPSSAGWGTAPLYKSLFKLWIKSLLESSLRKRLLSYFFSFFSKRERFYLLCLRSGISFIYHLYLSHGPVPGSSWLIPAAWRSPLLPFPPLHCLVSITCLFHFLVSHFMPSSPSCLFSLPHLTTSLTRSCWEFIGGCGQSRAPEDNVLLERLNSLLVEAKSKWKRTPQFVVLAIW